MDSRWFKEDRALEKNEQQEAVASTQKVLKNSTILRERLQRILQDEFDKTLRLEEDFDDANWQLKHVAQISRRKTLREIMKLIDF